MFPTTQQTRPAKQILNTTKNTSQHEQFYVSSEKLSKKVFTSLNTFKGNRAKHYAYIQHKVLLNG